ncbi:hypothetical protein F4604DRAFT_1957601 [Suillus subluteus]|nr:hypothetical protein F4604DRAFT_1957601 [Suillus subluteus]
MSEEQCLFSSLLFLSRFLNFLTVLPSFEGTWARLSQVAVKGAQYNSPERQPHPKCLEGTRVDLLKYIHRLLDEEKKNQIIWLHGTAGVGKSSVAFTVAERMKGLKVTEETNVEKRLAGTFFFSRKHTKHCTTGYFFATLAYQLANNFPSIRKDVNKVIHDNPALLDSDTPLCDQMEAFFLKPLRWLRSRLRECPPLTFVINALDECTSEPDLTDLILSLARALREPDLLVTHILLTSRSELHICKAFQNKEVQPLLCEIPVKTSGEGAATIISLDGADVDKDIYIFLQHSFTELASRHRDALCPIPREGDKSFNGDHILTAPVTAAETRELKLSFDRELTRLSGKVEEVLDKLTLTPPVSSSSSPSPPPSQFSQLSISTPIPSLPSPLLSPPPAQPLQLTPSHEASHEPLSGSYTTSSATHNVLAVNSQLSPAPLNKKNTPIPGIGIPDLPRGLEAWRAAVKQWEDPSASIGGKALKDWPEEWYTGPMRTITGVKRNIRKVIATEFYRLHGDDRVFLEEYPEANCGAKPLFDAIQRKREGRGEITGRASKNGRPEVRASASR